MAEPLLATPFTCLPPTPGAQNPTLSSLVQLLPLITSPMSITGLKSLPHTSGTSRGPRSWSLHFVTFRQPDS